MYCGRDQRINYFAEASFRRRMTRFGIKRADRFSHMHIIGKTGSGKTTLLETLIRQDIQFGEGMALIDPHGDLVERIALGMPAHRATDVVYLNAPDRSQPWGYNPLRHVHAQYRPLAASGILEVFKKLWPDAWGVRMEHVLRNTLLALLDQPDADLSDVPRLLLNKTYRREVIARIENEQVRSFWVNEFSAYSERYRADSIAPILNKVGAFLADPILYRILTDREQPLRIRKLMDESKVLLVNLAKGRLGDDSASLLGALLMTSIGLAAFSRADTLEKFRTPFFVYADEFQAFTTLSVANMVSELRKFGIALTLAHQYLEQISPDVRAAIIGNAGTLAAFRLGADDAAALGREFYPEFSAHDLMSLPNYHICVKLMIDGTPSNPFSAVTVPWKDIAQSHLLSGQARSI